MENITMFTDEKTNEEFVIIDLGNGEFNSMPKAEYDRRKAEQQENQPTL